MRIWQRATYLHPLPRGGEAPALTTGAARPGWVFFVGVLLWLGVGWGSTQPLGKIATETGHRPFGLIFWQQVVMVAVLGAIALVRRKGMVLTRACAAVLCRGGGARHADPERDVLCLGRASAGGDHVDPDLDGADAGLSDGAGAGDGPVLGACGWWGLRWD